MENLVTMFGGVFHGKTVWLSGITGFKGTWLAEWLLALGANVRGFALTPLSEPSMFEQTGLGSRVPWENADLRDPAAVRQSLLAAQPDFVLHLAAQPLVRLSYDQPVETYATNVMGTIHVMEALRALTKPCAAVLITTDKCYENREWVHGYREEDPVGGHDPYSSSKAACEVAIASWRRSFFKRHPVKIASARAGNVIGGGDWAKDRIIPDCVRALAKVESIPVRNRTATRPWQHVLEPLSGYLWLAAVLAKPELRPYADSLFPSAFNFGPRLESNRTVSQLVEAVLKQWPGQWIDQCDPVAVHEAGRLNLVTDKAFHLLDWEPVWSFEETVFRTTAWYRHNQGGADPAKLTRLDITDYGEAARSRAIAWAR